MPAEVYEIVALAARFWFLLLMGLIVWYSYRWYARERRARKRLLKELPDAGFVGEFVVMHSVGQLEAGTAIRVPFEGTLGLLRNNDICLEVPGVAPRHIYFRYEKKRGLRMTPMKGNHFAADHLSSEDDPDGLYVVHGTRLYVGECELRLRMFEGYEVTQSVQQPVPEPADHRWCEPGMGYPQGGYVQQPVYAPASAAPYRMPGAPDPGQEPPAAGEPPYGRRVHFSEARATDNPYRSRRSVPGLRRDAARREGPSPVRPAAAAESPASPPPEEPPVQQSATAVQTPPLQPAEPGFSAMSEYARMMAQPLEQEPEAVPAATPAQPAAQEAAPVATPARSAAPETAPAATPAQSAAPEAAPAAAPAAKPQPGFAPADSTLRPKAARAEAIHRAAAAPGFTPAEEKLPHVVFEESPPDDSTAGEELFHPLMDEDDWDAWEELPPPAQPVAQQRAEAKPAAHKTEEEDWPYLSRTDQWRTEGLFADLLDDDGTDATAQPGGAYGSRNTGSATRRMLGRYFKGGGR